MSFERPPASGAPAPPAALPFTLAEAQALRELAVAAAHRAGAYLRGKVGSGVRVERKGAIDLVTEADRAAEALVIGVIRAARPGDAVLAEERGGEPGVGGSDRVRWIIDPLDGTTNFAHSLAIFAVSVGVEVDGVLAAGAVHVPMLEETFAAARGGGATLNGQPIAVSAVDRLADGFLATGFPYDIRVNPQNNLDHFARFATRSLAIRRAGAASIDLAYVACGRFDGFWELRLAPWDVAAGALLIQEAGGRITNLDGTPHRLGSSGVCASNGRLHDAMLAVLAGREPGD
jgi:myo-inositol-1(or 4)-monophosphatase